MSRTEVSLPDLVSVVAGMVGSDSPLPSFATVLTIPFATGLLPDFSSGTALLSWEAASFNKTSGGVWVRQVTVGLSGGSPMSVGAESYTGYGNALSCTIGWQYHVNGSGDLEIQLRNTDHAGLVDVTTRITSLTYFS